MLDRARALIKDVQIGYLATAEGDQPRVRAMSVRVTDEGRILTATSKESRKYGQIMANPRVEFCFVSKDWDQLRAEGHLKVVEDQGDKNLFWGLEPALKDYFKNSTDPNYVLFDFVPTEIDLYEARTGEYHQRKTT
ncbi:MAG: pyridoxamine 5'-phosphate oxidase family protein [Pseudomonadota bacterium]